MQIHYFWINHWKYFYHKGVNLSAKYQFHLDSREQQVGKSATLTIATNPDFIEDFFEKNNVTNVTALIGKNGAGKSSILNYIKAFFPEGLEAGLSTDLIVYSSGEGEKEMLYVLYPYNWELEVKAGAIRFVKEEYSDSLLEHHFIRTEAQLSQIDYIYYSYMLDFQHEASDWKGLNNLSTTALIEETRRAALAEVNPRAATNNQTTDLDYLIGNEVSK
jgi:energy-coupling factor transporter ATP-binding protein EcfA2